MSVSFDFGDSVVLVTGASGALGSAVCETFADAGATVAAADVVAPDDEDAELDAGERIDFYEGDFTDEADVERVVSEIVDDHGGLDYLINVAGTWRGGTPVAETDADTFDFLFDVNLKTTFLAAKHALPHLRESSSEGGGGGDGAGDDGDGGAGDGDDARGAIVSVSARASLEGGEGDAPYRASKAGVRLLTESIAEEEKGAVRANAVMPSVIDTPANREMMPDADHDAWVDPADIAETMLALCSDATSVTSGAAVPVYGEA
ncbi:MULTISPECIES: SDR family NAD(P)-dependent oxidoreductase [Halorussus]|uniref:SDR family NAD(P)-dependent oxidoreductase n=1 Tax=Halorussus TaxID=1070314 RepID=UPI000E21B0CA|nr:MULTISPECIES: SDR family NAD(P)-dependent oxidoreductase [Halorussus]NHN59341.1 SDR family NAD(P)-dependent oxidoreductase [Halorussus sp. JP-T4]